MSEEVGCAFRNAQWVGYLLLGVTALVGGAIIFLIGLLVAKTRL